MKPLNLICMATLVYFLAAVDIAMADEQDPVDIDANNSPGMLEASFISHGARLNALHYTANGAGPHPTVLLLHGYPGNEKNLDLAQHFRRHGWNVFFFHYRGAWGSEGSFTFVNAAEDVAAALDFLRNSGPDYRVDPNHIAIVGHSMGGAMTLVGASLDAGVQCAVTLAAASIQLLPMDESAIAEYQAYADGLIMLRNHDGSNVLEQDRAFELAYPMSEVTAGLEGKNVFLIAAENDQAVPLDVFKTYVELFSADPDIHLTTQVYPDDHSFSVHRITLARRITEWLDANCR